MRSDQQAMLTERLRAAEEGGATLTLTPTLTLTLNLTLTLPLPLTLTLSLPLPLPLPLTLSRRAAPCATPLCASVTRACTRSARWPRV